MSVRHSARLAPDNPRIWGRYVRVSSVAGRDGEAFVSPTQQLAAIDRLIRETGGLAGPEFTDLDRTGRDFQREGVQAALAWVAQDPANRGLATYDVSRLGRNTSETLAVVKRLRASGAAFASSVERIDDTPEGDLTLTIWSGLAELQSRQIARRWASTIEGRARRGQHHGVPPLGYHRPTGRGDIEPDPVLAPVVREVFRRYAAGDSVRSIVAYVTAARGKAFSAVGLKKLVRNSIYVGRLNYNGEVLDGRHEPLVDQPTFDRAQARVRRDSTVPGRLLGRTSVLSGLLVCAHCGRRLALTSSRGERRFLCPGRHSEVPAEVRKCKSGVGAPTEAQILDAVLSALRDETEQVTVEPARVRSAVEEHTTRVTALEAEVTALDTALGKLAADHALGRKSDAAYSLGSRTIEHERREKAVALDAARADLARAQDAEASALSAGQRRVLKSVVDLWNPEDEEAGARLLRTWIERVYVRRATVQREPMSRRIRVEWTV